MSMSGAEEVRAYAKCLKIIIDLLSIREALFLWKLDLYLF